MRTNERKENEESECEGAVSLTRTENTAAEHRIRKKKTKKQQQRRIVEENVQR